MHASIHEKNNSLLYIQRNTGSATEAASLPRDELRIDFTADGSELETLRELGGVRGLRGR